MKLSLTRDIVIVLAVKIAALALLWFFFVHHHEVPHGPEDTTHHILGAIFSNSQV